MTDGSTAVRGAKGSIHRHSSWLHLRSDDRPESRRQFSGATFCYRQAALCVVRTGRSGLMWLPWNDAPSASPLRMMNGSGPSMPVPVRLADDLVHAVALDPACSDPLDAGASAKCEHHVGILGAALVEPLDNRRRVPSCVGSFAQPRRGSNPLVRPPLVRYRHDCVSS